MKKSAGLVIIQNNTILLGHPSNAKWVESFSFPKGGIEKDESKIEAAIRETKEEVGIDINEKIIQLDTEYVIEYKNKKGKIHKKVYYYLVFLDDDTLPVILPENLLQLEEIDFAAFYTKEEAEKLIFWRFKSILEHLN